MLEIRWKLKHVVLILILTLVLVNGMNLLLGSLPLPGLKSFGARVIFLTFFQDILLLALVLWVVEKNRGHLSDLGLTVKNWGKAFKWGVFGGFLILIAVVVVGAFSFKILKVNPPPQTFEKLLTLAKTPTEKNLLVFLGVFLGPFAEELFFRGFSYPILKKYMGVVGGIAVSSLLFGAMHFDPYRFLPLSIGGAILAYLYEKTGTLLSPFVAHATWNGIMTWFVMGKMFFY
ncbi:CPBP family intramembrane glutamic endopeptidase [Carboxydothermus pertinax]|uniref:CAAX amino terminal protease n=1 Tax=Carboxydothermus pertinax TaxID=870242 RepID=A0A1L8CYD3_9THEO|nr:CPBP family intramembrane glutamic endopeptidase [Carboxydothermus pertinax]GAV23903.1 CAAX amino terminal protease [Carboxydothermus pertinax]